MSVARQLAFPGRCRRCQRALLARASGPRATGWTAAASARRLGQRQRVALARALTRHSELLLFDEPFAALDTPRRRRLQQSLRALQREIAAVTIIVTHDPDEAALLADEVLVVEQGRVLQAGFIADVFERPASMRVAALLGLHNVGEGSMTARGARSRSRQGSTLATGARHGRKRTGSSPAGQQVMWRVSSHALVATPRRRACGRGRGGRIAARRALCSREYRRGALRHDQ